MSLRHRLMSVRRLTLAVIAVAVLTVTTGGLFILSASANGAVSAAPIACNGPCTDPGGGGG